MLQITIPAREMFDERTSTFYTIPKTVLNLEHSLLSIRKWESKWKIPFLHNEKVTIEQSIDYVRCMTLNQNVDPIVYMMITNKNLEEIREYINDPMTATTFSDNSQKSARKQVVTSEIIYYWMISYGIPFEAQKWHINQLLTLIRVCEIKNAPKKKMSRKEILAQNRALNEARKNRRGMSG